MNKVKFVDQDHKYFSEDGKELISVSKFTDGFKKKVDWDAIAAKVAKKEKKTKQEILDLWEKKRNQGASAGTILHDMREKSLLENDFLFNKQVLQKKSCPVHEGCKWSLPTNEISNGFVYPELMIYDFEHMICGQSDKVIVKDNKIHIYDYKTDKSIDMKAFSNQWTKPEKLLPPIEHLDNSNGNVYALKMSLYMYLLWKANRARLKPGDIILEWLPIERDMEGFPVLYDGKPKVLSEKQIKLPYLKEEVIAMLKTIKK